MEGNLVPRPGEVKSTRQEALADLMQQIFTHEESGRSVPCVNPKLSAWWLSEDVEVQEAAARACTTCPALRDCRAYIDEWPEDGGVWAARIPATRGRHTRDLLARGGAS
ncbi:hypothetical protein [Aeromicrobium sp. Leaf245]|uniref:hypothetical protein n=1 Tax=Aeromicrobium sp. Leaf245 TaxID=1736306 RepID=UPI0012E2674E|nr:hypothetical protein [Aeromicrobium sp. Leaf245]